MMRTRRRVTASNIEETNCLSIWNTSLLTTLNTRLYELEYLDEGKEVLSSNILVENILTYVDEEGY